VPVYGLRPPKAREAPHRGSQPLRLEVCESGAISLDDCSSLFETTLCLLAAGITRCFDPGAAGVGSGLQLCDVPNGDVSQIVRSTAKTVTSCHTLVGFRPALQACAFSRSATCPDELSAGIKRA
jgi:hypothetical protein